MPFLPITDSRGNLLGNADGLVWATMLFPRSKADRERYLEAELAKWLKRGPYVPRWSATMEDAQANHRIAMERWGNNIKKELFDLDVGKPEDFDVLKRMKEGTNAGLVLIDMISIGGDYPSLAGVRKITNLQSRRGWYRIAGGKSLRNAYAAFGSVKHLWAAHSVQFMIDTSSRSFVSLLEQKRNSLPDPRPLIELLAFANYFRNAAKEHVKEPFGGGPNGRSVIEDWIPPSNLGLPDLSSYLSPVLSFRRNVLQSMIQSKKAN